MALSLPRSSRGFSLVEILVGVAIVVVLVGLLLPGLRSAMRAARDTACLANLHAAYTGMEAYRQDSGYYVSLNANTVPGQAGLTLWFDVLIRQKYLSTQMIPRRGTAWLAAPCLICPANKTNLGGPFTFTAQPYSWASNYGMNASWGTGSAASRVGAFAATNLSAILLIDVTTSYGAYPGAMSDWNSVSCTVSRGLHGQGAHALLGNGSVILVTPETHPDLGTNMKYWSPR